MCGRHAASPGLLSGAGIPALCSCLQADLNDPHMHQALSMRDWELAAVSVACQAQAARLMRTVLGSSHAEFDRAVFAPFSAGMPCVLAACMSRMALTLT